MDWSLNEIYKGRVAESGQDIDHCLCLLVHQFDHVLGNTLWMNRKSTIFGSHYVAHAFNKCSVPVVKDFLILREIFYQGKAA